MVRYGYRDLVDALHLDSLVRPLERVALGENIPPHERPKRMRMLCEELGPTFVKLGQLLSTRPDLLPEAYTQELSRLRDDVKPVPFSEIATILTEEFGKPPSAMFEQIDETPVASASISQVHRAILPGGQVVALKVRRPGIEKVAQADLDILRHLAQLAERRLPTVAPSRPVSVAKEFERTLKRELDFTVELRTIDRCRTQFANDPEALIPQVFHEYSTSRVLAMEFIGGVGVDHPDVLIAQGLDLKVLASRGARILFKQIFRFGLFHADPHPGNLRVMPDGVIALLDYGMFGHLDALTRERIGDLLTGLLSEETDRVIRALDRLEVRGDDIDVSAYRRDVSELVSSYSDLTLEAINLKLLLSQLISVIRAHHLRIPPDLLLLIRALITTESLARALDPRFDIASALKPFLLQLARRRYSPRRWLTQAGHTADDLQRIATLLPDVLRHSLESIRRGELTLKFDLRNFEDLVRELIRASNTLAAGIVVAGLAVASALVLRVSVGGLSLGYIGFGLAMIGGLWMVWNMFKR